MASHLLASLKLRDLYTGAAQGDDPVLELLRNVVVLRCHLGRFGRDGYATVTRRLVYVTDYVAVYVVMRATLT